MSNRLTVANRHETEMILVMFVEDRQVESSSAGGGGGASFLGFELSAGGDKSTTYEQNQMAPQQEFTPIAKGQCATFFAAPVCRLIIKVASTGQTLYNSSWKTKKSVVVTEDLLVKENKDPKQPWSYINY